MKLVYTGDQAVAAVLDSPEEIARVVVALRHYLRSTLHAAPDERHDYELMLENLTAPAPE